MDTSFKYVIYKLATSKNINAKGMFKTQNTNMPNQSSKIDIHGVPMYAYFFWHTHDFGHV